MTAAMATEPTGKQLQNNSQQKLFQVLPWIPWLDRGTATLAGWSAPGYSLLKEF